MDRLDQLSERYEILREKMRQVDEAVSVEKKRLAATVTITKRKASTVFTAESGLAIVVSKLRNSHTERNVYWYKGKRTEIAISATRSSDFHLKIWIARQEAEKCQ